MSDRELMRAMDAEDKLRELEAELKTQSAQFSKHQAEWWDKEDKLEAQLERYKTALESIIGQTDDQFYEGVWREVNYTAKEALEAVSDEG